MELPQPNLVLLRNAWGRQQCYSRNATAAQKRFTRLRLLILILSVTATFLAVVYAELKEQSVIKLFSLVVPVNCQVVEAIKLCLLVVPIFASALLAGAVKFDKGSNWVLLRGSAEALKREIYFYRAGVGSYSQNRDAELAGRIKMISERLKGSPVHQTCLSPHETEIDFEESSPETKDDKFSNLSPEKYLVWRLEDQFNRYRNKAKELDKQLQYLQGGVFLLGGFGTFAVATGFATWVAVTGALTAAFSSVLELKRVETTLVSYNQAADSLYNTQVLWNSLSSDEKQKPANFELIVKTTEGIIQSENDSWLQDMQDRLAELYSKTDRKTSDEPEEQSSHSSRAR